MRTPFLGAEATPVEPIGPELALVGLFFLVASVGFTYFHLKHPEIERALHKNRFTRHLTLDPDAPKGMAFFAFPALAIILSLVMIIAGLAAL